MRSRACGYMSMTYELGTINAAAAGSKPWFSSEVNGRERVCATNSSATQSSYARTTTLSNPCKRMCAPCLRVPVVGLIAASCSGGRDKSLDLSIYCSRLDWAVHALACQPDRVSFPAAPIPQGMAWAQPPAKNAAPPNTNLATSSMPVLETA
jgi:hypothetical protein